MTLNPSTTKEADRANVLAKMAENKDEAAASAARTAKMETELRQTKLQLDFEEANLLYKNLNVIDQKKLKRVHDAAHNDNDKKRDEKRQYYVDQVQAYIAADEVNKIKPVAKLDKREAKPVPKALKKKRKNKKDLLSADESKSSSESDTTCKQNLRLNTSHPAVASQFGTKQSEALNSTVKEDGKVEQLEAEVEKLKQKKDELDQLTTREKVQAAENQADNKKSDDESFKKAAAVIVETMKSMKVKVSETTPQTLEEFIQWAQELPSALKKVMPAEKPTSSAASHKQPSQSNEEVNKLKDQVQRYENSLNAFVKKLDDIETACSELKAEINAFKKVF